MAIGRTFKEAFLKGAVARDRRHGLLPVVDGRLSDEDDASAARTLGDSRTIAHVGALPRARARLVGERASRAHEDRPVVPAAVHEIVRAGEIARLGGIPRACRRPPDARKRPGFSTASSRGLGCDEPRFASGGRSRTRARLQAHRYVRRRVRVVHAVHVLDVRARGCESNPTGGEGDDPRQRARTASGRASSSTIAAVTRHSPCASVSRRS